MKRSVAAWLISAFFATVIVCAVGAVLLSTPLPARADGIQRVVVDDCGCAQQIVQRVRVQRVVQPVVVRQRVVQPVVVRQRFIQPVRFRQRVIGGGLRVRAPLVSVDLF